MGLDTKCDKFSMLRKLSGFENRLLKGCLVCNQMVCGQDQ